MFVAFVSMLFGSAAASAVPQESITVVGRAIEARKKALSACLERRCPPDEDIDATLALAESQLISGDYQGARGTLLKSLTRNKKHGVDYPIPVSDLYRVNGRVAAHLGIDQDYYSSTWGIFNTLKKGMPDARDRHYSALMEVAEMMATTRGHERARLYYQDIARRARKDGRPDIAALAELRMSLRHLPEHMREDAVKRIAEMTDPSTRAAQLEARLALARIAYEQRDEAKGDAILADMSRFAIKKPILVYSPEWEVFGGPTNHEPFAPQADMNGPNPGNGAGTGGARVHGTHRWALNVADTWVDVGFRILPDGKVADVRVLKSRGDTSWIDALLSSVRGRRYTRPAPGMMGTDRTERYTFTSALEDGTGTHMKVHSPDARVEYFDLTEITASN